MTHTLSLSRPSIPPTLSLRRLAPLLALYMLLSALGLYTHELFLDEAHHFLLARDSSSLADLYYNARYDGHPRLWHTLLFFITHTLTPNPAGMQILHWIITTCLAFVFLRYAPFSLPVKAGLLFGYYLLFEYDLLSRNYAPGLLFLFLACALLTNGRRPLPLIGLLVLLMCNTHLFFTFASIGLYACLFVEFTAQKKLLTRPFLFFTACFLLGFTTALLQSRVPQADNVNLTPVKPDQFLSGNNISFAGLGLVRGWLPIPKVSHWWNHFWLTKERLGPIPGGILFLAFFSFPAFFFRKQKKALLFYYLTTSLLLVFFDVTQMTATRYFGMVFIFFFVAAWLASDTPPSDTPAVGTPASNTHSDALATAPPFLRCCLYAILILHLAIGLFAYEQILTQPFSQSRNTARFLQSLPAEEKIVVDGYNSGPMLCAYLGGKVFYLATGTEGSFCVWRKTFFPDPRPPIGQELARWPVLHGWQHFILVANRPLPPVEDPHFQLSLLKSFEPSIQGENYWVYQVNTH